MNTWNAFSCLVVYFFGANKFIVPINLAKKKKITLTQPMIQPTSRRNLLQNCCIQGCSLKMIVWVQFKMTFCEYIFLKKFPGIENCMIWYSKENQTWMGSCGQYSTPAAVWKKVLWSMAPKSKQMFSTNMSCGMLSAGMSQTCVTYQMGVTGIAGLNAPRCLGLRLQAPSFYRGGRAPQESNMAELAVQAFGPAGPPPADMLEIFNNIVPNLQKTTVASVCS